MKFFVDTANVEEIKQAAELGLCDGVTTNPTLIAREGKPLEQAIRDICAVVDGPVNAETLSLDYDSLVKEGRELAKIADNVIVKIPMMHDGLRAVKTLASEGIKTNVTLIFSTSQAMLAAKAGASYVSPFVGRLDDISHDGMELINEITAIFDQYSEFTTEVIVASIRNPLHVVKSGLYGAHIVTAPHKVLVQMEKHPLTDIGIEKFLADAKK